MTLPKLERIPTPSLLLNIDTKLKDYFNQVIKTINLNLQAAFNAIDSVGLSVHFTSVETAITHPSTINIPHTLKISPFVYRLLLKNLVPELGYTAGQFVDVSAHQGVYVQTDTQNFNLIVTGAIQLPDLTNSYTLTPITESNWAFVVNALG